MPSVSLQLTAPAEQAEHEHTSLLCGGLAQAKSGGTLAESKWIRQKVESNSGLNSAERTKAKFSLFLSGQSLRKENESLVETTVIYELFFWSPQNDSKSFQ